MSNDREIDPPRHALSDDVRQQMSLASFNIVLDAAKDSLNEIRDMLGGLTGDARSIGSVHDSVLRTIPRWHFLMLNDLDRNESFATVLEQVIPAGSNVLDIGSGTGLLAMMAARAGAATVTTCEANPLLAALARQIVAQNGLSDVITVVPRMSTDLRVGVDLPRRADVIVSEIVDCALIGEGLLPTVRHAREHLLAPGGRLIPESAKVMGALANSPAVDRLNRVETAAGFDVRLFNEVATTGHFPVRLATWPHQMLSGPTELASFDFANDPLTDGHTLADLRATDTACAHAMVVWFEMALGKGVILRNSREDISSHWMQAWVPFPAPVAVGTGDTVRVRLTWRNNRLSVRHLTTFHTSEEIQ